MSGHSKWAQIKRQKGVNDAKKGAVFTKIVKQITLSAREGGKDPNTNFKLRLALEKARESGMPKDNIDRAIKKGTGEIEGEAFEERTFEAYGPAGTAFIISTVTDNTNRTTNEIRGTLSKHGGKLATTGAVSYQFSKVGLIYIKTTGNDKEQLELDAIDASADDIDEVEEGIVEIKTPPKNLGNVKKSLEAKGYIIEKADIALIAQNPISISEKEKEQVQKLEEALEEIDDVTEIDTNLA